MRERRRAETAASPGSRCGAEPAPSSASRASLRPRSVVLARPLPTQPSAAAEPSPDRWRQAPPPPTPNHEQELPGERRTRVGAETQPGPEENGESREGAGSAGRGRAAGSDPSGPPRAASLCRPPGQGRAAPRAGERWGSFPAMPRCSPARGPGPAGAAVPAPCPGRGPAALPSPPGPGQPPLPLPPRAAPGPSRGGASAAPGKASWAPGSAARAASARHGGVG